MQVYLNGQFIAEENAMISIDDRGFLFAGGVYEVVHVYGGSLFEWGLHMERLRRSMAGVRLPEVDLQDLRRVAEQLVADLEDQTGEASLYLEITRGTHRRAHGFPPADTAPTILMWVRPVVPISPQTIRNGVPMITVADDRWAKVWIKTVGLLPNVLAKHKAQEASAFDAIFVRDGMVTEATSANLFMVQDGILRTAPTTNYILPGITRQVVLEMAADRKLAVDLRPFTYEELLDADEAFLTGTLTEVLPICSIDGHPLRHVSGPIARQLLEDLHHRAGWVLDKA